MRCASIAEKSLHTLAPRLAAEFRNQRVLVLAGPPGTTTRQEFPLSESGSEREVQAGKYGISGGRRVVEPLVKAGIKPQLEDIATWNEI